MRALFQRVAFLALASCASANAQTALTWDQVKDKFRAANPNLRAGELNVQESKASEVTAFLRPNPNFSLGLDQIAIFPATPFRPFSQLLSTMEVDYLHERAHKRELRLQSAQEGTAIAKSQQLDLERNLLFTLRNAFVQVLAAKALLVSAKENLDYFDRELNISRTRLRAGDIAPLDFDRLVLQRVQYESDSETATVNLRTAKITLLMLLNARTPLDQFDVAGPFEFSEKLPPLDDFHTAASDSRPDLQAAVQTVDKAHTDHRLAVANGSTDPTFSVNAGRLPPYFIGLSVSIPLRIFDRNQGEKARTQIDITHAERARDATQAQVFSDVDSAYYTLVSALNLLRPYRDTYLATALRVRNTMSFSYERGQAALVDFLDAQRDYRAVQVAYINLVSSYLTAAAQMNMAVGRDILQ
jgi:cobalt-zinc-cadmium efflux system outer membrane protein